MAIKDDIKRYVTLKKIIQVYSEQMEAFEHRIISHIATQPLRGVAIKESERIAPKWKEEFQKVMGAKFADAERAIKARTKPSVSKSLVIDETVHSIDNEFIHSLLME